MRAQLLDRSATDVLDTVRHLGYLQPDPTNRVARSHLLVLWSRLGSYDPAELDRKQRILRVHSLHLEPEAPDRAKARIEGALHELADWLGARDVALA